MYFTSLDAEVPSWVFTKRTLESFVLSRKMYNNFSVSRILREYDISEFPDLDTDDFRIVICMESTCRISSITS